MIEAQSHRVVKLKHVPFLFRNQEVASACQIALRSRIPEGAVYPSVEPFLDHMQASGDHLGRTRVLGKAVDWRKVVVA